MASWLEARAGVRKQGDATPSTSRPTCGTSARSPSRSPRRSSLAWSRRGRSASIRPWSRSCPKPREPRTRRSTFEQLLSHRSGMPANPSMASLVKGRTSKDPLIEQRRQLVAEIFASPPVHEKGTAFLYSNAGYVVVGAALERLTAHALGGPGPRAGDRSARPALGGLRRPGNGRAPSINRTGTSTRVGATRPPHPMPPGPLADNPPFLGPAGTLHLSVDDLAAWVREHMNGESGAGSLLSADSYRRLHRAVGDRYALGWVDDRARVGGRRAAGVAQRVQHHVVRDDRLLSRAPPRSRGRDQRRHLRERRS